MVGLLRLRAGCRAALFLWIFSNISCRARTALSPSHKCDEPLVSSLPPSFFSSSSSMPSTSNSYAPGFAKLNKRGGAGGWCPSVSDHYQWLQMDFGSRKQISCIATQGRYSSSDWVTQYRMLYSDTGRNWKPYHQDGNVWAFAGNINSDTVVRHDLQHPVVARYVRIVPLDWSEEGQIGLRIEIYGCSYWADIISFDGQGVLAYRFAHKKKTMRTLKDVIALKFKTSESEGVIFHGEGLQGDYITLELKKAKLVLSLNLGSNQYGSIYGHTSVTTGSLLDDHHWHSVVIERHGRNINLTLDRHIQNFRISGEFDYLDLDYEITFGGMPSSGKPSSNTRKNFKGCMESIFYNLSNITDLARRKKLEFSGVEQHRNERYDSREKTDSLHQRHRDGLRQKTDYNTQHKKTALRRGDQNSRTMTVRGCFSCGSEQHLLRDCEKASNRCSQEARSEKQKGRISLVQSTRDKSKDTLQACQQACWIIDSGAVVNLTNEKDLFSSLGASEQRSVSLANGHKLKVAAEGTVFIPGLGQKLESVLYVPQLDCNLLSVSALDKQAM
nr:contactin-associated protein-like 2 [Pogona vitticeps]